MSMLLAGGWLIGVWLATLWLVRRAIAYARRKAMLDLPGRRRSHRAPTPRGGGIGIVIALLLAVPGVLWAAWPPQTVAGWAGALVLVAWIGWRDDRRPLGVLPRLAVQLVAAALFAALLIAGAAPLGWLPALLIAGVASINLHNFMDGIDGLLALQAAFVGGSLAALAWMAGAPELALAAAGLAAASIAFWQYNRSPARIFMGDAGSGAVGFLICAFSAMLWLREPRFLGAALIVSSTFVVDAGLTLASRMLRGRRWYAPHREHLYQWLVRRGASHTRVTLIYLAWNLAWVAPLAWLAAIHPAWAPLLTMAAYVGAALVWLVCKNRLARRPLHWIRHVVA